VVVSVLSAVVEVVEVEVEVDVVSERWPEPKITPLFKDGAIASALIVGADSQPAVAARIITPARRIFMGHHALMSPPLPG
jgi:hypothetical protein